MTLVKYIDFIMKSAGHKEIVVLGGSGNAESVGRYAAKERDAVYSGQNKYNHDRYVPRDLEQRKKFYREHFAHYPKYFLLSMAKPNIDATEQEHAVYVRMKYAQHRKGFYKPDNSYKTRMWKVWDNIEQEARGILKGGAYEDLI